jgi:hypothetical protein
LKQVTVRTDETTPHGRAGEPAADELVQLVESRLRSAKGRLRAAEDGTARVRS